MTKKAIIYARVSTLKQADEGLPIESQIEQCRRKAEQLNASVARVFRDDGISGRISSRPAFQEAVDYCSVFGVDFFICWNTARFARNKIDAAGYKQILRKANTKVVYVATDIDGESDDGWLLEGLFELMDEQYSRTVSKDTRRSMIKNARDGFFNGGAVPLGYLAVADGKRKRLAINDVEAQLVRQIFGEYLQGGGTKSIALALNLAGRYRRGKSWTKNTVNNLLRNWVFAGYITFNRTSHARTRRAESDWIRTKSHPAIITEEQFMAVQTMLGNRAPTEGGGSSRSGYLFTGILRCGTCNMGMQIETATGRSRTYSYYNCAGALKGKGCPNRRIPSSDLDQWLLGFIMDRILSVERIAEMAREIFEIKGQWVKEREVRRAALVSELRDAEARRKRIFDVLELHGRDAPNLGDLTVRLRELNARVKAIEVSLINLEDEPAPTAEMDPDDLAEFSEVVREMVMGCENPRKVRDFLGSFIETVTVNDGTAVINYHPSRLMNARPQDVVHSKRNWLPVMTSLRTKTISADLPSRFRRAA